MADISSEVIVNQALIKQLENAPQLIQKAMRDEMMKVVVECERRTKEKTIWLRLESRDQAAPLLYRL